MSDMELALWIIVVLLGIRCAQAARESAQRKEAEAFAYAAERAHSRAIADLARALLQSGPSGQLILTSIEKRLSDVLGKEGTIMKELDDLNQAVADLQAASAVEIKSLNDIAAQLKALIGQSPIDPAAVEAAAQAIEAVAGNLTAATAAVAPPPPAAPAAPAAPVADAASGS